MFSYCTVSTQEAAVKSLHINRTRKSLIFKDLTLLMNIYLNDNKHLHHSSYTRNTVAVTKKSSFVFHGDSCCEFTKFRFLIQTLNYAIGKGFYRVTSKLNKIKTRAI